MGDVTRERAGVEVDVAIESQRVVSVVCGPGWELGVEVDVARDGCRVEHIDADCA